MSLRTPLTELFGIKHPVMLAGMNVAAGPDLAAAVTNAGGIGVIGGVGYSPKFLRSQIRELKEGLVDKKAPFGVDLLIPQVGGSARKTNRDYTEGKLPELIDIIIEEKAALFVCAIGVPPKEMVDKLHKAGIPCMNMVGAAKHCKKALDVGMDIICCQGGEGGGHTGDTPTSILIPACVEAVKGRKSPLTGKQVEVVAAGGIHNGAGLAAALSFGASAVWVGTRFICAEEAGAPKAHQEAVISAGPNDTIRSIIFTGRPLRVRKTPFIMDWEENRQAEIKEKTSKGILPVGYDTDERPWLMGVVSSEVHEVVPAKKIVEDMVKQAVEHLNRSASFVVSASKL
ncbi:2-nitropropane dioxygenase [Leucosporidium creatinivorum]|uniref:2-nitropropane dioxygenase n=1 Tax=Leucosporidium creatinivorum TaxID=106004 RepID=A0A1Y2E9F4_9BASI|nr:2-nitropropane dioxygenase [Leucosporidium creatinivorum]